MANRQVRQLMPLPADEDTERPRTFSEFIDQPNIVLLGDPGAGKTHLFRSFTAAADGIFFTVRNFLNSPPVPDGATLFIDALDEKRAGRGDDDAIDGMVQMLFASPPGKVRISCRERDWLGASDLAAFQLYFDQHGGVIVLSLQALSVDEQKGILLTQGIDDPDAFLNEAAQRGLEDFLTNPPNLIMLAQVVRSGDWPKTRSELFETFTRLLLTEHNPERARAGEGVYGADELRATAGAACAVRLISDVAGISLSDQNDNPDYPSYQGRLAFWTPGKFVRRLADGCSQRPVNRTPSTTSIEPRPNISRQRGWRREFPRKPRGMGVFRLAVCARLLALTAIPPPNCAVFMRER